MRPTVLPLWFVVCSQQCEHTQFALNSNWPNSVLNWFESGLIFVQCEQALRQHTHTSVSEICCSTLSGIPATASARSKSSSLAFIQDSSWLQKHTEQTTLHHKMCTGTQLRIVRICGTVCTCTCTVWVCTCTHMYICTYIFEPFYIHF